MTDCYQYLRPSGSFTAASEELCAKATKSWFSISNIIYRDKRIPVTRAFQLFDTLVSPVALYGCELWFPTILAKNIFKAMKNFCRVGKASNLKKKKSILFQNPFISAS